MKNRLINDKVLLGIFFVATLMGSSPASSNEAISSQSVTKPSAVQINLDRLKRARAARDSGKMERSTQISARALESLAKLNPSSPAEAKRIEQMKNAFGNLKAKTENRPDLAKEDVIDRRRVKMARDRLERARKAMEKGNIEAAKKIVERGLEGLGKVQDAGVAGSENQSPERAFIMRAAAQLEHQLSALSNRLNPGEPMYIAGFDPTSNGSVEVTGEVSDDDAEQLLSENSVSVAGQVGDIEGEEVLSESSVSVAGQIAQIYEQDEQSLLNEVLSIRGDESSVFASERAPTSSSTNEQSGEKEEKELRASPVSQ